MSVLKEGVVGGALNLYFIYKFLRILTTPWESTDAFKFGIVDKKGKILKKHRKLKTDEEKDSYTMMHRLVWKLKRLMEKIPFGKSRLASYAAALWLIKEEKNFNGTDEELQESFLSFLETDWKNEALILKENYEGDMDKKTYSKLKEGIDIKKASMKDVIKDFQSSDAPQFKGKSDKKKKEMAIAAKLSKEEVELDERPQWTIKNTKTGQRYSVSKYKDDKKLDKIRKGGGDHKHAAHYKDGKVLEEFVTPNRAYKEKINKHLKNHSGKFKWKDDTLHVEKGIESGVKSTLSKAKVNHPTIKISDNPMRENKNYKQFEKNKSNVSKKDSMKEVEKSNKAQAGIEEARKPYDIYHPTFSAAVQHAKDHTKKVHGFDVDQDSWDREVTFGQRKPSPGKTAIKKVNLTKDGKSVKKRLHMQVYGMDSGKYELNKYVEDYDGPIEDIAKRILVEGNGLTKADIAGMAKKLRVPLVDIISWDHGAGTGGREWIITLRGGENLEYMEKSGIVKIPKAANPNMKAMRDYLKNMKSIRGEPAGKIADVKLGKNYLIGGLENAFKLLSR